MEREWFSVSDLLDLRHPDLPSSRRGLLDLAKACGWDGDPKWCRQRDGQGGGMEYHLRLLPHTVQRDLALADYADGLAAKEAAQAAQAKRETLWNAYQHKSQKQKDEAARRLAFVRAVDDLLPVMSKTAAIDVVARRDGASAASITRYCKAVEGHDRSDWLAALVPHHTGGLRRVDCDPRAWDWLVADYMRQSEPCFQACHERMMREAKEHGWGPIPSAKTLKRRIDEEISPISKILLRKGPKALERFYPAQRRSRDGMQAMEAVNADGHVLDVHVLWEDGSVGRAVLVGFQDVYSGMILSHRLARSECQEVIRLATADMVESWGIPQTCFFDNGKAFMSKMLTGRMKFRHRFTIRPKDPIGVLVNLGINVRAVKPFHGQSKPIERAWRDLAEYVAKHPKCEGAYTGKDTSSKPENYGSKAIPIAELRALVADEIRHHNLRAGRTSHTAKGRSLWETFRESYEAPTTLVTRATAEQREYCLLAAENITVHRNSAQIHLADNMFWHEDLIAYAGKRVVVKFDPQNMHADIQVYSVDGAKICTAQCVHAVGFMDADAAREHARNWRAFLRAQRELASIAKRLSPEQLARSATSAPEEYEQIEAGVTRLLVGNTVRKIEAEADADAFARGVARLSGEIVGFPEKKRGE